MQLMPVVSVAADGATARARWRELVMAGRLGEYANGSSAGSTGTRPSSRRTRAGGRSIPIRPGANGCRRRCSPTGRRRSSTRSGRARTCRRFISRIP
jgi:hypothetical protein